MTIKTEGEKLRVIFNSLSFPAKFFISVRWKRRATNIEKDTDEK